MQKRDLDLKKRDEDVIRLKQQKNKLLKEINSLKEANEKMTQELASTREPKVDALMLDDLIPTRDNPIVSLQTGRDFDELSVASHRPSMMTEAQAFGSTQRKKAGTSSLSKFQRSPSAPKQGAESKQNMQTS